LLVIDEAAMTNMTSKKNIESTKLLFEGRGIDIQNKWKHSFLGFENTYVVLTANSLRYPW
jgi:hypothetical protein